jgi:hypothetical protein
MRNKKSRLFLSLAVLAAAPLYGSYAWADEDHDEAYSSRSVGEPSFIHRIKALVGKYGWTTQQVCVRTLPNPPGVEQVDPATLKLLVPAEIVSMAGVGTAEFKPNGTFHIDDGSTADSIQHSLVNPGDTPLTNGFSPVCDGTYSIGSNNRAELDWNCTIKTGNPAITIAAGPVNMDGWVADDAHTIDVNLKGTLQTLTFKQNGTPILAVNRLCMQRFVFHKLPR